MVVRSKLSTPEEGWRVPRQKGAKDGWVEVPLWVAQAAYAIGKGHWMLKEGGDVALPGDTIVKRGGNVSVEREIATS